MGWGDLQFGAHCYPACCPLLPPSSTLACCAALQYHRAKPAPDHAQALVDYDHSIDLGNTDDPETWNNRSECLVKLYAYEVCLVMVELVQLPACGWVYFCAPPRP